MLIPPLNWGLVEKGLSRSSVPLSLNFDFLTAQRIKTIVWMRDEGGSGGAAAAADAAFVAFVQSNHMDLIQLGGTKTEEDDEDEDDNEAADAQSRDAAVAAKEGSAAANPPITKQPSATNIASVGASVASTAGSWKPTSESLVLQALRVILDPRAYPLHLVCSGSGRHRTGVVVGCFRKLQRWALSSIFAEYRRYAGSSGLRGADDLGNALVMNEQFIELFDIELLQPEMDSKGISKHLKSIHVPSAAAQTTQTATAGQAQSTAKDELAQQQRRLHAGVQSQIAAAAAAAAASSTRALMPAAVPALAHALAAPSAATPAAAAATAATLAPPPRPAAAATASTEHPTAVQ